MSYFQNGETPGETALLARAEGPAAGRGAEPELPELVIEATTGWRMVDFGELARHGDMLRFMIWRDIRGRYAQSALGIGWAVVQPLATALIFSVVFGRIVGVSPDGAPYPLFVFCGLVPWTYFSNALNSAATTLTYNAQMISKIYFPRLILPLAAVVGKLVDLAIAAIVLVGFLAWYHIMPTPATLVMVPLLTLIMVLAVLGMGLWLSAMAVQYRDVAYGLSFAIQLLMFLSPVVYSASKVPAAYRVAYGLNPMAGVISGLRAVLLNTHPIPWDLILPGMLTTLVLVVTGLFYFRKTERLFADVA